LVISSYSALLIKIYTASSKLLFLWHLKIIIPIIPLILIYFPILTTKKNCERMQSSPRHFASIEVSAATIKKITWIFIKLWENVEKFSGKNCIFAKMANSSPILRKRNGGKYQKNPKFSPDFPSEIVIWWYVALTYELMFVYLFVHYVLYPKIVRNFWEIFVFFPKFSHFYLKKGELLAHLEKKKWKIWRKTPNFLEIFPWFFPVYCV